jgi:hypothetical protein
VIAHEFADVETAKESGRTNFGEMLDYLRKHAVYAARSWWKNGLLISRDSRSSEQFVHGIKVLMARNYNLNLVRKPLKG